MELVGYAGPETGVKDHKAFVLTSGACRFVVKGGVAPRVLCWTTTGAATAWSISVSRSSMSTSIRGHALKVRRSRRTARPLRRAGHVRLASIAAYGETIHTLVDRSHYDGIYLPGYVARTSSYRKRPGARPRIFSALDHVVGNVRLGEMDSWVGLLQPGHGLHQHGRGRRRHRHRLFGVDEQGGRQRQSPGQVLRSTSQPSARRRARSTSTSSSTSAWVFSTSRSPPTTSWALSTPCGRKEWSSSPRPTLLLRS